MILLYDNQLDLTPLSCVGTVKYSFREKFPYMRWIDALKVKNKWSRYSELLLQWTQLVSIRFTFFRTPIRVLALFFTLVSNRRNTYVTKSFGFNTIEHVFLNQLMLTEILLLDYGRPEFKSFHWNFRIGKNNSVLAGGYYECYI